MFVIYIFLFACLAILLITLWQKNNVVYNSDFLGITYYLGWPYWVGLTIITIIMALVWLYDIYVPDNLLLLMLVIFALYLLGIPILFQKNPFCFVAYYPAGEVQTVLNSHHIDLSRSVQLISYTSWPALHLYSATLMLILGISLEPILKYMPLFWILAFILLSYLFKRNFSLNNKQYLILMWLVIASFWVTQYYYSAQSFALLLYILLLAMLFKDRLKWMDIIIYIICYAVLIIFHSLTPLALLFCMCAMVICRRQLLTLLLLNAVLFVSFYLYMSPQVFAYGVQNFIGKLIKLDLYTFTDSTDFQVIVNSFNYLVVHYAKLIYLAVDAILICIIIITLIKRRIVNNNKNNLIYSGLSCLVGIGMLLAFQYGTEMQYRVYLFSLFLIFTLYILLFPRSKFILIIAILFTILHIPAQYGDYSTQQTLDSELAGSKFLALDIKPKQTYAYRFYPYVRYYDPSNINVHAIVFAPQYEQKEDLGSAKYIADSFQSHNYLTYVFDKDPVRTWLTDKSRDVQLIYDNGNYQTFMNLSITTKHSKGI